MFDYWFVLPVAIIIAVLLSAIGIGGGILWMAFFLIVLKLPPENAVLTSLMIQTAGMGSASLAFAKQQRIDLNLAFVILAIALPGVALGAFMTSQLPAAYMQLILGLLVITTAFLFVSSPQKYHDLGQQRVDIKQGYRQLWIAIPAAIASGLLSTSMNEWLIPMLRSKLSLAMHYAIATSIFITFGISVIATIIHLGMGNNAYLSLVLWAVPGVIIGGQIGSRMTNQLDEKFLKEMFIFFLTLVGVHLIYNAY